MIMHTFIRNWCRIKSNENSTSTNGTGKW